MRPMYVSSPVFANVTTVCVPSAMVGREQHSAQPESTELVPSLKAETNDSTDAGTASA